MVENRLETSANGAACNDYTATGEEGTAQFCEEERMRVSLLLAV